MKTFNERAMRNAGGLYFLLTVTSIFSFFVPQTLVVSGDAAATAGKILANEALYRWTVVLGLVSAVAFIFLGLELYRLLSDVNKAQATVMVVLVMLTIPLSFVTTLTSVAVLSVLHGGSALSGFSAGQIDALAVLFIKLGGNLSALNSIFFGLWLLPFGTLVLRSGFIPRVLAYAVFVAGASYLVSSLNFLLAPPFAGVVSDVTLVGFFGELAIVGWLSFQAARIALAGISGTRSHENRLPASD